MVCALLKSDESRCIESYEMRDIAADFYAHMFTSKGLAEAEHILHHIEPCVTDEMERKLTAAVKDEEIEEALLHMGLTKAPGPDRPLAIFYQ